MNFRPSQIVILAAGVVILVFSFFNFVTIDTGGADVAAQCDSISREDVPAEFREDYDKACGIADDGGFSAWNTDFFFPLSTWPAILGAVVAGLTAAAMFAGFTLPDVLGLRPNQLLFGLALPGALMMLGWLVMGVDGETGWGIGFWLMLVGSLALVAGTVMELLAGDDAPAAPRAGTAPPTPF